MKGLRPISICFVEDGGLMKGFFHKFTQGNMHNDCVIIEDLNGMVHVFDLKTEVDTIMFDDRREKENAKRENVSN